MPQRPHIAAAIAALLATSQVQAITLDGSGAWAAFDVDPLTAASGELEWIDLFAGGAPLSFEFSIATGFFGTLTVVDAGFAGDRFLVTNGSSVLGRTSVPGTSYPDSIGLDFDAALADPAYSRAVYTLGAGDYSVSGYLIRSAVADGLPLYATVGGVRLEVSAVPEPASWAALGLGLGFIGLILRRRQP